MSVPGLNAVHEICGVRLNDLSVFPRVRLRRIVGWNTRPEMQDFRDVPIGRAFRETPRRTQLASKALVYEGTIEAQDQDSLEEFIDELLGAFSSVQDEVHNVWPYAGGEGYFWQGRVSAFDPPEELPGSVHTITRGFQRPFTLGVRMTDARKSAWPELEVSAGDVPGLVPIPEGPGLIVPFNVGDVIPAQDSVGPLFPLPPDYDGQGIWLFNDGTAPADLVVFATADGAGTVDIRNASIGRRLRATPLGVSASVEVNFRNRTVISNGSAFTERIDAAATDWWDANVPGLRPGWNKITGATKVRYFHAYL
jgi:hypothetical protein